MNYNLKQSWTKTTNPKPIVIIGAGGIVNDAHLPAYKKAGFEVIGVYDIDKEQSKKVATKWHIKDFNSIDEVVSYKNSVVYDLAVPPSAIVKILRQLPDDAGVLIQKPMGENYKQALEIKKVCDEKNLTSAVNFQLRFSPQMLALKDAIDQDILGELLEIDVKINISTPWQLFPFLTKLSRVEIAVHSIHYLDLIRSISGNPKSVFAKTMSDPRVKELTQTRTSAILDYESDLRCILSINHNHNFGNKFHESRFRFEGTKGAVVLKLGVNLNYPDGEPDEFWIATNDKQWEKIELEGEWFTDAFMGTMGNLQRYIAKEDDKLITSTNDAIDTMALVEACFEADKLKGVSLPSS